MLYLYFLLYIVYIIIYRENKTVHLESSWCTPSQERKDAASSGCTWRLVGALLPRNGRMLHLVGAPCV